MVLADHLPLISLFADCPESDINILRLDAVLSGLDQSDPKVRARIIEAFTTARTEPGGWFAVARAVAATAEAIAAEGSP